MINMKLRLKIIECFGNQSKFAKKLNIQDSVISLVVRGRYNLTLKNSCLGQKHLIASKKIYSRQSCQKNGRMRKCFRINGIN